MISKDELTSVLETEVKKTDKIKKIKQLRNRVLISLQFVLLILLAVLDNNNFIESSKIYTNILNTSLTTLTAIITNISMSKEIEKFNQYIFSLEILVLKALNYDVEENDDIFDEFIKLKTEFINRKVNNDRHKNNVGFSNQQ